MPAGYSGWPPAGPPRGRDRTGTIVAIVLGLVAVLVAAAVAGGFLFNRWLHPSAAYADRVEEIRLPAELRHVADSDNGGDRLCIGHCFALLRAYDSSAAPGPTREAVESALEAAGYQQVWDPRIQRPSEPGCEAAGDSRRLVQPSERPTSWGTPGGLVVDVYVGAAGPDLPSRAPARVVLAACDPPGKWVPVPPGTPGPEEDQGSQGSQGIAGPRRTFDEPEFSIVFKYPAAMRPVSVNIGNSAGQEASDQASVGFPGTDDVIIVTRYELNEPVTKDSVAGVVAEADTLFSDLAGRELRGTVTEIGGLPAIEYSAFPIDNPPGARSRLMVVFDGATQYLVNCQSTAKRRADLDEACDVVRSTLKLR